MKKITILFAMVLCLASCIKPKSENSVEDHSKQTVVFDFRLVEEVPMTKAVDNNAINEWIENALPSKISLKLIDANGTRYNIETGTSVELPVGIYTVTGKNTPTASASVVGTDVFMSMSRPTLIVSTTIEVTYTQTSYLVPATYGAFGIVVDLEETATASFSSSHGEQGNIEFATIGTSGIVFINGNLDSHILNVTLNPISSADEVTTYVFKTAYSSTTISPTFGNYYILHPKGISSVDGGTFGYSISPFRAVDIEN